jgi:hypothetical protein
VRALRECVNARVRSSGAVNAHRIAKNPPKRTLQVVLDRIAMRLALPTGERRTIVSDDKF